MSGPLAPYWSYGVGSILAGVGLLSILAPTTDYEVYGLPLENSPSSTKSGKAPAGTSSSAGHTSPMVYAKGSRDLVIGLAFIALERKGHAAALTSLAGISAIAAFGDGLTVWLFGGDRLRGKAFAHWGGVGGLLAWAYFRYLRTGL